MESERPLAWNGLRLSIPARWEARVTGACHLVFEEAFQPLLQLRWYKVSGDSPRESLGLAAALAKQEEPLGRARDCSPVWRRLESRFHIHAFAPGRDGIPAGGAFSCPECHSVFHFQLFPDSKGDEQIPQCLTTLSCHGHDDDLWRIQDFSLSLPPGFNLVDYSFAAGLTRLSFAAGKVRLTAGRLAPAADRLNNQTLARMLRMLTGIAELQIRKTGDQLACEGYREPGWIDRLRLRLRGDRPFVRARIRHDPARDRLLSLVLSGMRPLPAGLLREIAEGYELV